MAKRKTKILFTINRLDIGGAGKMVKYVASLCTAHNFEVTVIEFYSNNNEDKYPYRVIDLNLSTKELFWRFKAIGVLRKHVIEESPDIICAFVSDIAVMTYFSCIGLPCIFSSAERGDPYTQPFIWDKLVTFVYNNSDYLFFQLERARNYYKKCITKSFVIPNPYIETEYVSPCNEKREKKIVSAGRFEDEKGFDLLIKAFKIVLNDAPDYKLFLYGEGSKKEEYIELASKLGIGERVVFAGYSKNVRLDIRDASVFVLPSRFEGIPNVLIEAMSVGVPVVACDCSPGGPAFLTDNGNRGVLVRVGDPVDIAKGINSIIHNPSYSDMLGKKELEIIDILNKDSIDTRWIEAFTTIIEDSIGVK